MRKVAIGLFTLACAFVTLVLGELVQLHATVSSTATNVVAIGNGANTTFTFPFIGVSANDIVVTYIDTSGNQTVLGPTTYTITLNAAPAGQIWGLGGTVTYPLIGSPIATGTQIVITRTVPLLQTTSFNNQGALLPQAIEQALDLVVLEFQGVATTIGHSLQVSPNDTCVLGVLPVASQRANQLIGFDSTGCNPIAAQPTGALVSAAMQPVVAAATIGQATTLLGVNTNFNTPIGFEGDWPGLIAPAYWKFENGAHISRLTYSALLAAIAPIIPCTITSGSATISGIGSTAYPGLGTGWIIESPGSTALTTGQTISTIGGTSITITGGNASANATQCQIFPFGTAQDGTFTLPNAPGVIYAGLDTANTNLNSTFCTGNPAFLNAACGAQSTTLASANLPNANPAITATFTGSGSVIAHLHDGSGNLIDTLTNNASADGGLYVDTPSGVTAPIYRAGTSSGNGGVTIPNPAGTISGTVAINGNVTQTAFSSLPPTRIRNKIIFAGAP